MNIHNVSLTISAVSPKQYPGANVPEIAFAGRSNVGKSSFINKVLNRKFLARTSSKPGKTATINFFNLDNTINFVDLPGYGYAQVSKEEKKKWRQMIETYLNTRETLAQVILLVDSRHAPTADDLVMMNYIRNVCQRAVVVASKFDKLKKSEQESSIMRIIKDLKLSGDDIIIAFSAVSGEGTDMFWDYIYTVILDECGDN